MGNHLATLSSQAELNLPELGPTVLFLERLGGGRFIKSLKCSHENHILVVKVYCKSAAAESVEGYGEELALLLSKLSATHAPNVQPFRWFKETSTAAFIAQQYIHSNLLELLSTPPFLTGWEKRWIAFQLLQALVQCHSAGVCHGDIKPENLPDRVIPIPSGKGVYVKVKDCGPLGTTPALEAPYWTCAPVGADLEVAGRTTEVGQHEGPQRERFYWDHNDDETKAGWGIFFSGATTSKCVQCYLRERHTFGHSLRFGADEEFDNRIFFKVCGGSKSVWTPHKVHGDAAMTRGSIPRSRSALMTP